MNRTWSQVVCDIEDSGMSLTAIANAVGLAKSSLSEIKSERTKQPRGGAAIALHELHKQRMTFRKQKRKPA